jgi:phosphonate transport system substrate-binding protein
MMRRGNLKLEDFRIIFRNPLFPTFSCAYAHDLNPALVAKIKEAFFSFKYPPEMSKAFEGTTNFVPIDYKKDWQVVRDVAAAAGETYTREGLSKIK